MLEIEDLGCYDDDQNDRDLPIFMGSDEGGWDGLSHLFCAGLCAAAGYKSSLVKPRPSLVRMCC